MIHQHGKSHAQNLLYCIEVLLFSLNHDPSFSQQAHPPAQLHSSNAIHMKLDQQQENQFPTDKVHLERYLSIYNCDVFHFFQQELRIHLGLR